MNTTINVSTGFTLFYMLYSTQVALPIDHALPSSSYKCSYFPCCKYKTDCAACPCHYGKGTTGLEVSLQSLPYRCRALSRRCCLLKHLPLSHCGLTEVDATFCWPISHHIEDQWAGIWSLTFSHHGINSPNLLCVSTKTVSYGYYKVTRTYFDWWRVIVWSWTYFSWTGT